MRIAGIVLAAGSASRMGTNKLLLRLRGESLVRRAARAAVEAGLDPVLVVLGHEADLARAELAGSGSVPVLNARHALGMSTSLDAGVAAVPADASAAVVLLADMPFVAAGMVRAVVDRYGEDAPPIVASRYGAVSAPPVLYARSLFTELRGGTGEGRGREVVQRHADEIAWLEWPRAALADLDEPDDVDRARAWLQDLPR